MDHSAEKFVSLLILFFTSFVMISLNPLYRLTLVPYT